LLSGKKTVLSFPERIIGTFMLGLTQIILTELFLGVLFQKLYAIPLLALNAVVSGLVLFCALSGRVKLGNGVIAHSLLKEPRDKLKTLFSLLRHDWLLPILAVLAFIIVSWTIFLGYLFPSYTWDGLWYHLPIVGYILQSGAIEEINNHFFIDQFINIFPKNIELFFLWNIIFLKSSTIVDLSQLLFAIMGIAVVFSICRKMGIQQELSLCAGLLFFFTPIIILQSTTNYVDVAITVLFLTALNFLLPLGESDHKALHIATHRRYRLVLAGLSAGVLLGSKGSGPLFLAILTSVVFGQELKQQSIRMNRNFYTFEVMKHAVKNTMLYFILPAVIVGGYWYGKNWVLYGNPVYPMDISFFGFTLFKGLYKGIIEPAPEVINRLSFFERPIYVWMENIRYYLYDSRLGGLGPLWIIIFVPSVVFSLIYAAKKKMKTFLVMAFVIIAAFFFYPRNWTPRYIIFIVALGAVSFAVMLDYFQQRRTGIKVIALILVLYTCFALPSPAVTPQQIEKFLALTAHERTVARQGAFNIDLQARQEYGHWIWISNNIQKDDVLAFTFEPLFHAPLWNTSFTSSIAYVKAEQYREWIKALNGAGTTHVLVRTNSREDKWIRASYSLQWLGAKETFKVKYADENYTIARYQRG
jgi:hypothetical protein